MFNCHWTMNLVAKKFKSRRPVWLRVTCGLLILSPTIESTYGLDTLPNPCLPRLLLDNYGSGGRTLTNILDIGLLDRGELGELTGRHLLLDAYHRAVELEQGDRPEKTPPNFSAGCRLITFIKALFIDECANVVLDSTPDNMEGIPLKEAFKDALVCFTHFGKMADDTGISSAAAWAAFIHHMAIMCRNGQRTVYCILPVLLWDTRLCEHVMTGVLVQFKRQIQSGTIAELSIDQAKIRFFPKALEECTHGSIPTSYRPYISLIMELGVQVKIPEEAKTATMYKPDRYPSS